MTFITDKHCERDMTMCVFHRESRAVVLESTLLEVGVTLLEVGVMALSLHSRAVLVSQAAIT